MYLIFLTGTAGSGKSTLAAVLKKWYQERKADVITLNLDPGVLKLPYEPDVDIRDYISIQQVMEEYGLGPNGALVAASDMIAVSLNNIKEEMEEQKADYIVVDTPGQLELFAFRESGPFVVNNLGGENKVVLFLFDFTVASSPFNFLSTTLLYNSLKLRLNLPQLSVLTKTDLSKILTRKIMDWCANKKLLEEDMSNEKNSERYLIGNEILKAFSKLSLIPTPIPISSVTWNGMLNLGSAISNILRGGEEFIE